MVWVVEGTWGFPLKYLGIFLGNTVEFERKLFNSIKGDIETVLCKWKFLAPILSYRGRVLIINNLCASMLWHRVMCSTLNDSMIKEIQKLFLDFFWQKKHWLPKYDIYLPVDCGGQGLIDIESRIKAFRFEFLRDVLFENHVCEPFFVHLCQV